MKQLILWSGGADSTIALLNAISEHGAENVRALAIRCELFSNDEMQCVARTNIIDELKKREITFKFEETVIGPSILGGKNTAMIPIVSVTMGALSLETNEDLIIGAIRGDSNLLCAGSIASIFKTIRKASTKCGGLYFPLVARNKHDIIKMLKKHELLDLVWYCCLGDTEPCGECSSCIDHKVGLLSVDLSDEDSFVISYGEWLVGPLSEDEFIACY